MKTKIYVPDIECDSCVKLIDKKLKQEGMNAEYDAESVTVEYDEEKTNQHHVVSLIQSCGFRAGLHPFERKSFSERWRDLKSNKHKYQIELKGIEYAIYTFFVLLLIEAIAYAGFLNAIPDFLANYGLWLLYLNVSVSVVALGIWHMFAYEAKVTCMVGMMAGMTIGMQSGLMLGAILGATNGFFIGALLGMILGVAVGSLTGKSCGIMGVMEGMMAGVMGGTMGPMITVMMFTDNLHIFMPFYMVINVVIMLGLSYMLFEEVVEHKKVIRKPTDFLTFVSLCIVATAILAAIMIFGPTTMLAR